MKNDKKRCSIFYIHPTDIRATRDEKLDFIRDNPLRKVSFDHIIPDKNNNWIELTENDWETMLQLNSKIIENTIFNSFSNGISTNRDEWVYDKDKRNLFNKIEYFRQIYNSTKEYDSRIKWSRDLKLKLHRGLEISNDTDKYVMSLYRPFHKVNTILDNVLIDVISNNRQYFINNNKSICCNMNGKDIKFLASDTYPDLHFVGDTKCLPLYRYDTNGNKIDNITDWGLQQFQERYETEAQNPEPNTLKPITKEDIFHYVYAVLHNPAYRKKYEMNLKREFPRVPFYEDFWKWADWGKKLMELHINFETVEKYPLRVSGIVDSSQGLGDSSQGIGDSSQGIVGSSEGVVDSSLKNGDSQTLTPNPNTQLYKPKLKADKDSGTIELDNITTLSGVPKEAWEYKLGNRSALEWILDQYKEKKPKDPTIAEKFNTYRFADYKDKVIDLLMRVTTVSVETVKIVREMER